MILMPENLVRFRLPNVVCSVLEAFILSRVKAFFMFIGYLLINDNPAIFSFAYPKIGSILLFS